MIEKEGKKMRRKFKRRSMLSPKGSNGRWHSGLINCLKIWLQIDSTNFINTVFPLFFCNRYDHVRYLIYRKNEWRTRDADNCWCSVLVGSERGTGFAYKLFMNLGKRNCGGGRLRKSRKKESNMVSSRKMTAATKEIGLFLENKLT